MHRVLALLVLVTACGRFGFQDQSSDDASGTDAGVDGAGVDGAADAPPDAVNGFNPASSNCTAAASGPFDLAGTFATQASAGDGGFGVWGAGRFVMMADMSGGLHSLRFDGTTFSEVGHLDGSAAPGGGIGWVEAVWSDAAHYYVAAPGAGFYVVDADATGALAIVAEDHGDLVEARKGWVSGGTVFVPAGSAGVFAMAYDGATLAKLGQAAAGFALGLYSVGSRVFLGDGNSLRVMHFDGSGFTELTPPDTAHGAPSRVWVAGETILIGTSDGLVAATFDGTTLDEIALFATSNVRDVWSDGTHIFIAASDAGFYALTFDGATFAEVAHVPTTDVALGVFGDGTYVYANGRNAGLRAYRGFECTSTTAN